MDTHPPYRAELLAQVHLRALQSTRRSGPTRIWWRSHSGAAASRTEERVFTDIDSLLLPVNGHHKQGASFRRANMASRALLCRSLSPQITAISTPQTALVFAEAGLHSGRAPSRRAAARQIKVTIGTARPSGVGGALSPVCNQLRAAGRRGRYHPPPPRYHQNHIIRTTPFP
ncbi:hypothetical protein MFM001_46210 [Mycobacterium sp. MFM001]|nr:hypothetical protein MFM001_46210 [Mycobacterium sp. MFM001]